MLRIVFPTNKRMSYISKVESSFEESNYLTILNVTGQKITEVETIKNPHPHSTQEIIQECKENNFGVLILPNFNEKLPIKTLKDNGISVYRANESKIVLNIFSDFIQDKLKKVS